MDLTSFSTYMEKEDMCMVSSPVTSWDLRDTENVQNTCYDSGNTHAQSSKMILHTGHKIFSTFKTCS
jgi:hypothetical protein